jgi:hypothetical protein
MVIAFIQIAMQVVVMRQGGWTIPTRFARLLFELASFYVSYVVLGIVIEWLKAQPWSAAAVDNMLGIGYKLYPLLAALVVLAAVVDLVRMALKANPGLQEMLADKK